MEFTVRIKKSGNVVTEVTNRQDSICGNIKQVTNRIGKELSDEHIGPECDDVKETHSDS